jgi:hypothetical protein
MCRNLEIIARENRRVIKNGQSRDTDNIGHTRYRTKTNKTQKYNTTQHRKLKGDQQDGGKKRQISTPVSAFSAIVGVSLKCVL